MWFYTISEWNLMTLEERVDASYNYYTGIPQTPENFVMLDAILNLLQNLKGY